MGEIDSIYNQMQGYLQKAQLGMLNQYNQGNLMHQMDQLKGMNPFYGGQLGGPIGGQSNVLNGIANQPTYPGQVIALDSQEYKNKGLGTKKGKDWNFDMGRPMTNTEWLDEEIFKYSIKL